MLFNKLSGKLQSKLKIIINSNCFFSFFILYLLGLMIIFNHFPLHTVKLKFLIISSILLQVPGKFIFQCNIKMKNVISKPLLFSGISVRQRKPRHAT